LIIYELSVLSSVGNKKGSILRLTSANGYARHFSRKWSDYIGVNDGMGWTWERAVHPDDHERTKNIWLDCLANVKVYETEFRIRRYDGKYRWFLGRANPCCKFLSFYLSPSELVFDESRRQYIGKLK
jgi:PAS domain-containing protein